MGLLEPALDLEASLADLRQVSVQELSDLRGDSVLEATLRRLQSEAENASDAWTAFDSAI